MWPDLDNAVRDAIAPTWSEIVRAKKEIIGIVSDGKVHGVAHLQRCLAVADGVPLDGARDEALQIGPADDINIAIQAVVTKDHPLLARHRLLFAASEAVVDLVAQGVLVEVAKAPNHVGANPLIGDQISIPYHTPGYGAAVQEHTPLPNFAHAYRLSPRLKHENTQWFADPDVFTADLGQLQLDGRTRRCIVEALDAYRRGLFLSCANMLGAASEGAWYAAGERLRHLDSSLAKALDSNTAAKVIYRVAELLRHTKGHDLVDELRAQAALLKGLRNYGIHPRGQDTDHLERYFSDSGAAMLLMQTYNYLTRLTGAVDARLVHEANAGSVE